MSSLEDPRMRNGWAEYQRLVLAELERLNKAVLSLDSRMGELNIQIVLLKEENGKIRALASELAETRRDLGALQQGDAVDQAITKYRNWIIGLVFAVVVSAIIPLISLVLG